MSQTSRYPTRRHWKVQGATGIAVALAAACSLPARAETLDLTRATIADIQTAFQSHTLSAETLTALYLARIKAFDKQGPGINAVITINPNALREARNLDRERRAGNVRGPLHGIPILVKDNYNTADMPTTAGSQLLAGSIPPSEAFVLKKLRSSGAIIIAKVNMSEFAGDGGTTKGARDPEIIKLGHIPSGYSSQGLRTLNPHALDRVPSGSSGGTGASVAAAFGQFGLGTDTGGSIRYPSSFNGIVGLKPTHGLVSRTGIVPLALSLDTAGPMARSVHDVAVALGIMVGIDLEDPTTHLSAGKAKTDYTEYLKAGALEGARIGIGRDFMGCDPAVDKIAEQAIVTLRSLGAEIIDPITLPDYLLQVRSGIYEFLVNAEFKAQITDYLQTLKPGFPRSFDEIVALANDPATRYRSPQKAFALKHSQERAVALGTPTYLAVRNHALPAIKAGMEAVFAEHDVDAIFTPTVSRTASLITEEPRPFGVTEGPRPADGAASAQASCRANSPGELVNESWLPEIVVPAGMTDDGLPVTVSFIGTAFSEDKLIGYAYDFEQATRAIRLPKNTPLLTSDMISD